MASVHINWLFYFLCVNHLKSKKLACHPGGFHLNMRYLFVQCSILRVAKQSNQQPGLIIACCLSFYWDFVSPVMRGACKLDSNTFWTPVPTHHICKPSLDSQQHTFGNNMMAMCHLFNHKWKTWLKPEPVNLFKVHLFFFFHYSHFQLRTQRVITFQEIRWIYSLIKSSEIKAQNWSADDYKETFEQNYLF